MYKVERILLILNLIKLLSNYMHQHLAMSTKSNLIATSECKTVIPMQAAYSTDICGFVPRLKHTMTCLKIWCSLNHCMSRMQRGVAATRYRWSLNGLRTGIDQRINCVIMLNNNYIENNWLYSPIQQCDVP